MALQLPLCIVKALNDDVNEDGGINHKQRACSYLVRFLSRRCFISLCEAIRMVKLASVTLLESCKVAYTFTTSHTFTANFRTQRKADVNEASVHAKVAVGDE